MAAAAPAELVGGGAWPLLVPMGIAHDDVPAQDGRATAAAAVGTSIRRGVKVWLEMRGRTWVLRTSRLEKPDPYGGRLIRFFPEVISADENLVLFRIRSPHAAIPTESFVYSFPTSSAGAGTPSVVRLPRPAPEITVPQATGVLRAMDEESFVVASLWQKFNPATGELDTFLHRWWYSSSSSKWIQKGQRVALPTHKSTSREWRTDCVVPFEDSLLWVNLTRGILIFGNLGHDDPEIQFVGLHSDLPQTYPRGVARTELFRSVGCSNGKLTLVNLLYNGNTLDVTIWTLETYYAYGRFTWKWNKENNICGSLDCQFLWDKMSAKLQYSTNKDLPPPWSNRLPCFPVLSKDKSEILYLTVSGKKDEHAWLLQIDMQAKALKDVVDYPGFCRHKKPPCPSDLSKYSPP